MPTKGTAPTWETRITSFDLDAGAGHLGTVRRMREVFGDSSRNGEWAAVRLLVDGDMIAEADAPGLARDLAGLTLLEAAAVGYPGL